MLKSYIGEFYLKDFKIDEVRDFGGTEKQEKTCQNHCKIAVCEENNGKEQCQKGNSKKRTGSEKRNHQNGGTACPFWG